MDEYFIANGIFNIFFDANIIYNVMVEIRFNVLWISI